MTFKVIGRCAASSRSVLLTAWFEQYRTFPSPLALRHLELVKKNGGRGVALVLGGCAEIGGKPQHQKMVQPKLKEVETTVAVDRTQLPDIQGVTQISGTAAERIEKSGREVQIYS